MRQGILKLTELRGYFLAVLLLFMAGFVLVLTTDKTAFHLAINSMHSSFLDGVFKYGTHLGDGLVTAIAVVPIGLLAFRKYRFAPFILGGTTLFFTGLYAQFFKRVVFPNAERPSKFIGEDLLYLVPDVDVHQMNSFPSGHTATAFAFFAFVSFTLFRGKPLIQIIMGSIAAFVGYSRMYLSQHFLEDVVAGAFVGIMAYLTAHMLTSAIFKSKI